MKPKRKIEIREVLRFWVENYYSYQKQRIQAGGRVGSLLMRKIEPDTWQTKKEDDDKSRGEDYNHAELRKKFDKNRKIFSKEEQEEVELMFEFIEDAKTMEKACETPIKAIVKTQPIYTTFLANIKGISHILAGGLIAWIDIHKSDTVSSLWAYAGLSAQYSLCKCEDGHKLMLANFTEGRTCNHLNCDKPVELIEVVKEASKLRSGYTSFWNPKLKKLCWKLGASFVKQKTGYREYYDKFREVEDNDVTERSKLHNFNRAKRKTVKLFLSHLYVKWRELEGLPVSDPYCEAHLDHRATKPLEE